MALSDLAAATGGFDLQDSPLDTARFGRPMARLTVRRGAADAGHLVAAVRDHRADVIVARHPAELAWVPAALAASGRDVLAGGGLVYWSSPDSLGDADARPGVAVVDARTLPTGTAAALVDDLVRDAFDGYVTHYSFDPLLDPRAVTDGQAQWARSCLTAPGTAVLVLEVDGSPAGIATLALDDDDAEILLAGVRRSHQGHGHYAALLEAAHDWGIASGARRVVISTQTHNVRVQRAWARAGWRPVDAFDTAHLVRPGLITGAAR